MKELLNLLEYFRMREEELWDTCKFIRDNTTNFSTDHQERAYARWHECVTSKEKVEMMLAKYETDKNES